MLVPRALSRNGWSDWHLLGAIGMLLFGAVATTAVWADIWQTARRHGEVGHLYLVPAVAALLIYVRRERFRLCQPVGTWLGPALVLVGWAGASVGDWQDFAALAHTGAVLILLGCILSVVGVDVLRRFLPAFGVLVFLIPAPWLIHQHVTQPFTDLVNDLSLLIYRVLGIDASAVPGALVIEGVAVPVVDACGAPGLKAIVLMAYAVAFAQPLKPWVRVVVLLATPAAAVFTQVLGTTLVAWLLHFEPERGWLGQAAGWLLLPVAVGLLVGLVRVLNWATVSTRNFALARGG